MFQKYESFFHQFIQISLKIRPIFSSFSKSFRIFAYYKIKFLSKFLKRFSKTTTKLPYNFFIIIFLKFFQVSSLFYKSPSHISILPKISPKIIQNSLKIILQLSIYSKAFSSYNNGSFLSFHMYIFNMNTQLRFLDKTTGAMKTLEPFLLRVTKRMLI